MNASAELLFIIWNQLPLRANQLCKSALRRRAMSLTGPSAITAKTALYLCSATLISLMRGSVKHQPGHL